MAPQITLTLDLTPETLEILKLLTPAAKVTTGDAAPDPEQLTFDDLDTGKDKAPAKKSTRKDKKAAAPKETPAEPDETADAPDTEAAETEDATPAISLTDVRAVALKLSKAGKQAKLKEIFAKYGAAKLSDISEEYYADLMVDLEVADE